MKRFDMCKSILYKSHNKNSRDAEREKKKIGVSIRGPDGLDYRGGMGLTSRDAVSLIHNREKAD